MYVEYEDAEEFLYAAEGGCSDLHLLGDYDLFKCWLNLLFIHYLGEDACSIRYGTMSRFLRGKKYSNTKQQQ